MSYEMEPEQPASGHQDVFQENLAGRRMPGCKTLSATRGRHEFWPDRILDA
ncbi:hypothetical protein MSKU9_2071 [Komagataeibacter diospyri]|uniref:Uncharacterized protein n=1 Tax=Komagataeibacter diospyri TaxID=1932662 RepID=A0A4P5NQL8_9PROT|nr:hypothetical protein MSKU9_2071 [Komagataeibacter diospyri]